MKKTFITTNENQLDKIAKEVLKGTRLNKFIFIGELGVGKTTFIKSFCQQLGVKDNISSPTFSIVNEYVSEFYGAIYHFDLYRIKDIQEIFDLGYEEYFDESNYCFIEWPEKIRDLISNNIIQIEILRKKSERIINIATL